MSYIIMLCRKSYLFSIFISIFLIYAIAAPQQFSTLFLILIILKTKVILSIVLKLDILEKMVVAINELFLFNTGLFFFNLDFKSTKYIVFKCNFLPYDA